MPGSANLYNLLGSVYLSANQKDSAVNAFEQAIACQYNNFSSWDHLLPLRGQPDLLSLAPLPSPESVLYQAAKWDNPRGENGAILSYIKDIFLYPSRCSRERTFMIVYMSSQAAIDIWKEYTISYNGYYQKLDIARAVSLSGNGRETPADRRCSAAVNGTPYQITAGYAGHLTQKIETVRTGIFAGRIRSNYRFLAPNERKKHLQKVLAQNFPNVSVKSLHFGDLDSLRDTIRYQYEDLVPEAARFSGDAGVILIHLTDRITGAHYPSEQSRHYDIDMAMSWFDIGEFVLNGELELPQGWRLISVPKPVSIRSPYGEYERRIEAEGNKIRYYRKAQFDMSAPIDAEKSDSLRKFLSTVALADDIALMFFTGDE